MPNSIIPLGDDQEWKKEVDKVLEREIRPALARLEELIRANR